MSYDYTVLQLVDEVTHASQLGPATLADLGQSTDVRRKLDSAIAGIHWMDWGGSLQMERGWIEFRVAENRSLGLGFTVHASHRSDHVWEESVLRELAVRFGWAVVDHQTLRLFDGQHDRQLLRDDHYWWSERTK